MQVIANGIVETVADATAYFRSTLLFASYPRIQSFAESDLTDDTCRRLQPECSAVAYDVPFIAGSEPVKFESGTYSSAFTAVFQIRFTFWGLSLSLLIHLN
ncbi:unnamed protein product [Protopolystoma xenopodis]|uniref:Uncharacterized protein n=1 Tax=Protopolystoma xenopodis TaxID=117903 RepID=A0A448WY70_9PLAT|nr:unnamed protein product [Protopolystoma xenopodis]